MVKTLQVRGGRACEKNDPHVIALAAREGARGGGATCTSRKSYAQQAPAQERCSLHPPIRRGKNHKRIKGDILPRGSGSRRTPVVFENKKSFTGGRGER